MKNITIKLILLSFLFTFFFLLSPVVKAQDSDNIEVWFFHSNGCSHCAQAEPVLEQMAEDNENLNLISLELSTSVENQNLFVKMAELYGYEPDGVPTVVIGDEWIVGFDAMAYRQAFQNCVENTCENPSVKIERYLLENNQSEIVVPDAVSADDVGSQVWYSIGFVTLIVLIIGVIVLNFKK